MRGCGASMTGQGRLRHAGPAPRPAQQPGSAADPDATLPTPGAGGVVQVKARLPGISPVAWRREYSSASSWSLRKTASPWPSSKAGEEAASKA